MTAVRETKMTRPTQKQEERHTLLELLYAIHVRLDHSPEPGEAPDFTFGMSGRTIGLEITMYESGEIVAGTPKRAIEARWEGFEISSQIFQKEYPELHGIYILFRFKDRIPAVREREMFFCEVLQFVRRVEHSVADEYAHFWRHEITLALMSKYLKDIVLRQCGRSESDSNTTAGFIAAPSGSISRTVAEKSKKEYRPADELWLAIQRSHRPSETILAGNDVFELNANADLQNSLTVSPFSRVYVFTAMGLFQWDRNIGEWSRLDGES
jgi:hypothetical protein